MQEIRDTYYRLLAQPPDPHHRYLFDTFSTKNRLIGLIGARGVGKTTLMLQWIREKENPDLCMYASLDHIHFSSHLLLDFVRDMYQIEGRKLFILDEVHKYPNWNRELKNIYDAFPEIKVIFSGSSTLDLVHGQFDLSRRGKIFRLNGLSFREYLLFKTGKAHKTYTFNELIHKAPEISRSLSTIPKIRGYFEEYLQVGYFPYYFEDPESYYSRIVNTIYKTIYEDIANLFSLSTTKLPVFKRLLVYLTSIPPGEVSINAIARNLGVDHKTTNSYLQMLEKTSLIHALNLSSGGKATLKGPEKILLENANLYFSVASLSGITPNPESLRETFFINALCGADIPVNYSKVGDYHAQGNTFEIGGTGKTRKQIRGVKNSFLVKDGSMIAGAGEIPLYLFGFLW